MTVVVGGETVHDVSMANLSHVLLPTWLPDKPPNFAERTPKWLHEQRALWLKVQLQQTYCSLSPAGCEVKPLKQVADMIVQRGQTQDVQVVTSSCLQSSPSS